MPRLIFTESGRRGLRRCQRFLVEKSPISAKRAARTIKQALLLLETTSEIGRPTPERSNRRELIIPFGASGYVAQYRYEPAEDAVYLVAFRHQKELGY
ncbi:type II toxin-antitoxin system RelE/ParE family toxin [Methylopila sp. M107]|uniref:type II toxin-antitoxin system RelE/ParE family toxin n=1 Tax=Methylopila sp. M107 TaxID=1101190 RepID=UPI000478438E|nr:type II toxin-antitoxin system RelE/ParE family toxin [Methylopila sp. M107]